VMACSEGARWYVEKSSQSNFFYSESLRQWQADCVWRVLSAATHRLMMVLMGHRCSHSPCGPMSLNLTSCEFKACQDGQDSRERLHVKYSDPNNKFALTMCFDLTYVAMEYGDQLPLKGADVEVVAENLAKPPVKYDTSALALPYHRTDFSGHHHGKYFSLPAYLWGTGEKKSVLNEMVGGTEQLEADNPTDPTICMPVCMPAPESPALDSEMRALQRSCSDDWRSPATLDHMALQRTCSDEWRSPATLLS